MIQTSPVSLSLALSALEMIRREALVLQVHFDSNEFQKLRVNWFGDLRDLDRFINELGKDNMPVTKVRVSRLLPMFEPNSPLTATELVHTQRIMQEAVELRRLFVDELHSKTILWLSAAETSQYVCTHPPMGQKVQETFPDASCNLEEASRCYALERFSAGVFHLVCALQTPLDMIAGRLKVAKTTVWYEWMKVILDIETAIKELPSRTPAEKAKRQYYQQAREHFLILKDARRNPIMHGRGACTPDQARQIWNSVEAFMQHLANGLPD